MFNSFASTRVNPIVVVAIVVVMLFVGVFQYAL
jgi:hypothetical protein